MKYKYLLDIAAFAGKRVQKFDGVMPFLSTGDLQGNNISFVDITYDNKPSRADIKVEEGDILFARMKDTKKVLVIDKALSNIIVSTGFAVLHPSSLTDAYYLSCYFKSDYFETQKSKYCSGAIQPAITNAGIKKIKVPFPPDNDRKRIAYLLNKVEKLILQRKQSLQQLDELIKSIFVKMFGDPVINGKRWNQELFSKILSNIESGWSPKCETRSVDENEWGVLKLGAVTRCRYNDKENKAYIGEKIKANLEVKAGDLLFTRKNTYELVAASAYVFKTKPNLMISDLIFRFIIKDTEKMNPIFLWQLLINSSQRKKIQSLASGAAGSMPNISKEKLKKTLLISPPPDLQKEFANIVIKIEKLKENYIDSLQELENFYNSLSHKAFKGELNLTKVPIAIKIDIEAETEQQVILPESIEKVIEFQERIISKGVKHLYDPNSAINIVNRISKFVDIPDYSSWQQSTAFDEEYEELENDYKQLNEQDIRQIFDHSDKAFSFKELLDELEKTTTIDFQHYEFIKKNIYKMLGDNELEQIKVDINKGKKDKPTEFILKFKRIVA